MNDATAGPCIYCHTWLCKLCTAPLQEWPSHCSLFNWHPHPAFGQYTICAAIGGDPTKPLSDPFPDKWLTIYLGALWVAKEWGTAKRAQGNQVIDPHLWTQCTNQLHELVPWKKNKVIREMLKSLTFRLIGRIRKGLLTFPRLVVSLLCLGSIIRNTITQGKY